MWELLLVLAAIGALLWGVLFLIRGGIESIDFSLPEPEEPLRRPGQAPWIDKHGRLLREVHRPTRRSR